MYSSQMLGAYTVVQMRELVDIWQLTGAHFYPKGIGGNLPLYGKVQIWMSSFLGVFDWRSHGGDHQSNQCGVQGG